MENTRVGIQELRDSNVFCHTACLCVLCVFIIEHDFPNNTNHMIFVIVKQCVYLR